ncbi:NifU family protein [Succinimonas sp.]|uniref:NifU family protein n=1 Tax=Succinimonas sp. TaxID=1936151 RepID=UPI002E859E7B|nr:NifU family protein [Succinimonas sp.]
MITITEKAEEYFRVLLKKQPPETGIRVFVSNPGTPGVECGILYCPKKSISFQDDVFERSGFKLVVDRMSQPYLEEAIIDYEADEKGHGTLTFKAPKLKTMNVPEDAPLRDKLEDYMRKTINPSLADHGGSAVITDVTPDGVVSVVFSGGCKGCSMANMTLKDGIEANLKQAFPGMVKEVVDATKHEVTERTYTLAK